MKFLTITKDGGEESTVLGLHADRGQKPIQRDPAAVFEDGSRDAYHSHAFNCISWVLRGRLEEERIGWDAPGKYVHEAGAKPVLTARTHLHKVVSVGRTWVLTFRGPWAKTWTEVLPGGIGVTLANGREVVERGSVQ
jgi:hypothetical protein